MTEQPKWPWPRDSELVRRTKVAVTYREHLHTANRVLCDAVDDAMRAYGQLWVLPRPAVNEPDSLVTTAEAAVLAGVSVETVRQWRKRGYLDHDRQRRYLVVRGLDENGWPMFNAGEVLAIVATTRSRRRAA